MCSCIVLWVVLSAAVIMVNKYVLAYSGFPFPVSLTLIHMLFCSSVATLLIMTGVVKSVDMPNALYFRCANQLSWDGVYDSHGPGRTFSLVS